MQSTADIFASSLEHIFAELQRLDILLRRAVALARSAAVHSDPNEFRGLVISEDYVDRLLGNIDFLAEPWTPDSSTQSFVDSADEALARKNAEIAARLQTSIDNGIRLSLPQLASIFALTGEEVSVLMIALAPELDTRYDTLYAYLQNDVTRRRPSVDLALNLLSNNKESKIQSRALFSDNNPMVRLGLLQLVDDNYDKQPTLLRRFLKLDDAVLHYLLEQPPVPKDKMALHEETWTPEQVETSTESMTELKSLIDALERGGAQNAVIHLSGADDRSLEAAALSIASGLGRAGLVVTLPLEDQSRAQQLALLRDAALWNALLLIKLPAANTGEIVPGGRAIPNLKWDWLRTTRDPVLLLGAGLDYSALPDHIRLWTMEVKPPEFDAREKLWNRALGNAVPDADPARLADMFPFPHKRILQIADLAASRAAIRNPSAPAISAADLVSSGRTLTTPNISRFAQPRDTRYGWDDLIVPADRMQQLRQIQSRVENRHLVMRDWNFGAKMTRGRGVAVLFTGTSGTGKTMAAGVLANALSLQLFQIDLAAVTSKYIGEAEKILSVIFQEAEESRSLLFFDECDAIFGKRAEVSRANDRYANLEVNYLLQRIEQYEGLVVLATNFEKNMDPAFLRRLQDVVDFPFPDEAARESIWKAQFSQPALLAADVDLGYLGRQFKLNGGSIRNASLNAAFLAAAEGGGETKITLEHLLSAIRSEFRKRGRLMMTSDLGVPQTAIARSQPVSG